MRITLFSLLFCCVHLLNAQQNNPDFSGKHREWRLTIAPQFNKVIRINSPGINADLLPPQQTPGSFRADTFQFGNEEVVYLRPDNFERVEATPTNTNFWFGIGLDYWWRRSRGMEFAFGLYYSQAAHDGRVTMIDGDLPEDYSYTRLEQRNIRGGISFRGHQPIWRRKQLHPYIGFNMFFLVDRSITDGQIYSVFPARDFEFLGGSIVPRFRENIIFDFDVGFSFGLHYQLANKWGINLEAITQTYDSVGLLQLGVSHKFIPSKLRE